MKKRRRRNKFVFFIIFFILIGCILISPYIIFNIKLIGDREIIVNYGDNYSESGYRLVVFGIDLTDKIRVSDNLNDAIGKYEVKYSYKFLFYDISTVRNVIVKDIKGPKIELVGGTTVDVVVNEEYVEAGYKATDINDGDLTNKVKISGEVDTKTLGEYKIIYQVSDKSGNESIVKRIVNVVRKNPMNMGISEYSLDGWYDDVKVNATNDMGDEYFNSLVIVGDSNMKNMYEYGLIAKGNAWAVPCLHAESMHYTKLNIYGTNKNMTLLDAVKENKPKKMIINLGSFSSIWISESILVEKASLMIEAIKKESPDTEIALISLYPVTQYGKSNDNFKQELLNRCNFLILELANKYKLKYLDVQTVLKDSNGYGISNYYIGDGFHLTASGHKVVKEYIKTHAF